MTAVLRALLLASLFTAGALAEVGLPALFGNHMVVQRDVPVHVWGTAEPGEAVQVEFRGQSVSTAAGENGHWEVHLDPGAAGGPFGLAVEGSNRVEFQDVHVGEVWVGSGQSNMVWPLERSRDAEQEIAAADYSGIRYFKVTLNTSDTRLEDVEGQWQVVSPETAGEFSGVGYFFARHLHKQLGVPMGIIQSAWGGTPAESWTSARTLAEEPALANMSAEFAAEAKAGEAVYAERLAAWEKRSAAAKAAGDEAPRRPPPPRALRPQNKPGALFNAMVAPLLPYPIRGVIWYQGENNAGRGQGYLYRRLFQSMIQDWRREWRIGAFPFLFVQLANYGRVPEESTWPELREAQAMALGLANTGMAVTIDIGNPTDIHPKNKQDVGLRLALAARAIAYGEHDLEYSGPLFRQTTRDASGLRLWFDHAGAGLEARGGPLEGFQVAGRDGNFVSAQASISGNSVLVSSAAVKHPVRARYAWAADAKGNLFNDAGLPASPFQTNE
jgi:sialate O-acetylesterase